MMGSGGRGRLTRSIWPLALVTFGAALALTGLQAAIAAPGDLEYQGCVSSDSEVGGCAKIAGAVAGGSQTGLDGLSSVVVSSDGASVYAASFDGDAVARFGRNPTTGALSFQDCVSSNSDVGGCTQLPGAAASGANASLDGVSSIAVSAGGASLYAASNRSDAVIEFDRDTVTGALTFEDCVSGDSNVTGCSAIPAATGGGTNTGLDRLTSVAVSADGESVYTASEFGDAVARFDRDPSTGALAFQDCVTSNSNVAGCTAIPGATAFGADTGLDGPVSVAVSADGEGVYTASQLGDAVAHFDRDPTTGALTFEDCVTSDSNVATTGGCAETADAAELGDDTALDGLTSVALSADGESVYTASEFGDAVARFDRDPSTGALAFQGCVTSNSNVAGCTAIAGATAFGTDTGLDGPFSVAVSADGARVYAVSNDGDALARFARDPGSGAHSYQGCISSSSDVGGCAPIPGATPGGTNTGLDSLRSVAVSSDGVSVYSASFDGDAVAHFGPDPPRAEPPSNQFTLGKLTRNRRRGTAKLAVIVPGPGLLVLAGKQLRRVARRPSAAGGMRLPVRAKGRAALRLRARGKVRVRARITYTPTGGTPNAKKRRLLLIRRR